MYVYVCILLQVAGVLFSRVWCGSQILFCFCLCPLFRYLMYQYFEVRLLQPRLAHAVGSSSTRDARACGLRNVLAAGKKNKLPTTWLCRVVSSYHTQKILDTGVYEDAWMCVCDIHLAFTFGGDRGGERERGSWRVFSIHPNAVKTVNEPPSRIAPPYIRIDF